MPVAGARRMRMVGRVAQTKTARHRHRIPNACLARILLRKLLRHRGLDPGRRKAGSDTGWRLLPRTPGLVRPAFSGSRCSGMTPRRRARLEARNCACRLSRYNQTSEKSISAAVDRRCHHSLGPGGVETSDCVPAVLAVRIETLLLRTP